MMAAPRAELGFTAGYFQKRDGIARWSVSRKICSGTVGDLRGRMIAASFTTGRRRVRMGPRGASAKSWFGGTRRKKNGVGWTTLISKRTWRPILLTISIKERVWRRWVERVRLRCIPMAWDGF